MSVQDGAGKVESGNLMDTADSRDNLALQRTRLANERTFLAYVRTALSLLAGGVVLFQFFATRSTYVLAGWLLVSCGAAVLIVGIFRFLQTRRQLDRSKA